VFESALGRSEASSSRLGTGAILSAGVHALVAALVLVVPGKTKAQPEAPPEALVIQIAEPKVAQGGSPAPAQPEPKAAAPAPRPKPAVQIPDKPPPDSTPQQPETPAPETPAGNDSASNTGGEGAAPGGGTGGHGPGTGNGFPEPKPTYTEMSWNATMERPVLMGGPAEPEYPRNAMLQHREGTVITRCRITTDGSVRDCSIVSGDVMLQQAALEALAKRRYRPLMYGGVPVSVWYMFRFTFKLKQ
jgi:periplasmic protein TonB